MDFSSIPFRLDRSRNATIQVFEHLRELIVSLAIPPGTVLARPQLRGYFKLSLSPVREALLRLEEEHLVDIYPQHQTRVRYIDLAMEFHRRMYEAAALPDLWSMMRSRIGNLDRLRRLHLPMNGKALSILEQHARIAESIGRGDPAAAQHTVRSHLGGTLNAIDALRERYPDLLLPADYAAPAA